jgi:hypothetical protein
MLNIRGMSIVEIFLTGVNRFGQALTSYSMVSVYLQWLVKSAPMRSSFSSLITRSLKTQGHY